MSRTDSVEFSKSRSIINKPYVRCSSGTMARRRHIGGAAPASKSSTEQLAATYVVRRAQLPWTADLIARLTDSNPLVRRAARRGLVVLSYFTVQAEKLDGSSTGDETAGHHAIVDFGPKLADDKTARKKAAKNWQDWWNDHGGNAPSNVSALRAVRIEEEPDAKAARLSADLVFAPAERRLSCWTDIAKQKASFTPRRWPMRSLNWTAQFGTRLVIPWRSTFHA